MKEFRKYSMGIVLLYLILFILKRNGIVLPTFFQSYLTDLLCLPVVLIVVKALIRTIRQDTTLELTIPMVLVAWIAFSVVFEWVLPSRSNVYTADIYDVLAYGIGGGLYVLLTPTTWAGNKKSPDFQIKASKYH